MNLRDMGLHRGSRYQPKKVVINGREYSSLKAASGLLGISLTTLKKQYSKLSKSGRSEIDFKALIKTSFVISLPEAEEKIYEN